MFSESSVPIFWTLTIKRVYSFLRIVADFLDLICSNPVNVHFKKKIEKTEKKTKMDFLTKRNALDQKLESFSGTYIDSKTTSRLN